MLIEWKAKTAHVAGGLSGVIIITIAILFPSGRLLRKPQACLCASRFS
jgi:hypothetical protein